MNENHRRNFLKTKLNNKPSWAHKFGFSLLLTASVIASPLVSNAVYAADTKIPRLSNGHPDFSGIWQTTNDKL